MQWRRHTHTRTHTHSLQRLGREEAHHRVDEESSKVLLTRSGASACRRVPRRRLPPLQQLREVLAHRPAQPGGQHRQARGSRHPQPPVDHGPPLPVPHLHAPAEQQQRRERQHRAVRRHGPPPRVYRPVERDVRRPSHRGRVRPLREHGRAVDAERRAVEGERHRRGRRVGGGGRHHARHVRLHRRAERGAHGVREACVAVPRRLRVVSVAASGAAAAAGASACDAVEHARIGHAPGQLSPRVAQRAQHLRIQAVRLAERRRCLVRDGRGGHPAVVRRHPRKVVRQRPRRCQPHLRRRLALPRERRLVRQHGGDRETRGKGAQHRPHEQQLAEPGVEGQRSEVPAQHRQAAALRLRPRGAHILQHLLRTLHARRRRRLDQRAQHARRRRHRGLLRAAAAAPGQRPRHVFRDHLRLQAHLGQRQPLHLRLLERVEPREAGARVHAVAHALRHTPGTAFPLLRRRLRHPLLREPRDARRLVDGHLLRTACVDHVLDVGHSDRRLRDVRREHDLQRRRPNGGKRLALLVRRDRRVQRHDHPRRRRRPHHALHRRDVVQPGQEHEHTAARQLPPALRRVDVVHEGCDRVVVHALLVQEGQVSPRVRRTRPVAAASLQVGRGHRRVRRGRLPVLGLLVRPVRLGRPGVALLPLAAEAGEAARARARPVDVQLVARLVVHVLQVAFLHWEGAALDLEHRAPEAVRGVERRVDRGRHEDHLEGDEPACPARQRHVLHLRHDEVREDRPLVHLVQDHVRDGREQRVLHGREAAHEDARRAERELRLPRHRRVEAHAVPHAGRRSSAPLRAHPLRHGHRGDPPRLRADHARAPAEALLDHVVEDKLRNLRRLPAARVARHHAEVLRRRRQELAQLRAQPRGGERRPRAQQLRVRRRLAPHVPPALLEHPRGLRALRLRQRRVCRRRQPRRTPRSRAGLCRLGRRRSRRQRSRRRRRLRVRRRRRNLGRYGLREGDVLPGQHVAAQEAQVLHLPDATGAGGGTAAVGE
eukprot:Rhum_TRINITY_DN11426_c0_g1::Rhum_TRINITY_DN11426_c0_g1_i1::g.44408::m.44408